MKPQPITRRTLCKTVLATGFLAAIDPQRILSSAETTPLEGLEPQIDPLSKDTPMVTSICAGSLSRHTDISRTLIIRRKAI